MCTELLVSTNSVLSGKGKIRLYQVEGFYYVKYTDANNVKFSNCVSKSKAELYVFDAIHYGLLNF